MGNRAGGRIIDWARLPNELLTLIASHLVLDQLHAFRSVCKTWHLVEPPPVQLHWLMTFQGLESANCKFYHPLYRNGPCLKHIPPVFNSRLLCSGQGWHLMFDQRFISPFFLNPFTEQKITLPDLPRACGFDTGTFTSSPTSTDCRVFCMTIWSPSYILIYTIQRGDKNWKTYAFDQHHHSPFDFSFCNPVFYHEMLYCLGREGSMGVFDPSQGQWTVLADPGRSTCHLLARKNYLMECQGKLVAVFVEKRGKWTAVFRLDDTKTKWEKVDNLGDQMIFLSKSTSFSATKVVNGMENKIYFPRMNGNHGVFYSLATGKYQTFGNNHSRNDLNHTEEMLHSVWIEPVLEKYSQEQLSWMN